MGERVPRSGYSIPQDQRGLISKRYKTVTRAVNTSLWGITSDSAHSLYVGSYGRGTAVKASDLDVLVEVPESYRVQSGSSSYNPQSRLLQVVKAAILQTYPRSEVRGDGQVVVINFSDGMKFEVLPAIRQEDWLGRVSYEYPDTHKGGRWLSTNPRAEQDAMAEKNRESNGLLLDTCKHMRHIRDERFSSYELSGIVIDSFAYWAIGGWRWLQAGEGGGAPAGEYEEMMLRRFNEVTWNGSVAPTLNAPGSGDPVETARSLECLGKVLSKIAG